MKDNKGFTLVELLAIIIILAIIMIIAAPSLTNEIKRSEEENKNVLNQKIDNAAHLYVAKYYVSDLVRENYENIHFTLSDLEQDGLIDLKDKCSNVLDDKNITIDSDGTYNYQSIRVDNCYQ